MSGVSPKRRPGRPKTVDRERAVQLAMLQWWREGAWNTSLNEVCRLSGLSKPSLYREFGGQDGLMTAALDLYEEQVVEPFLAVIQMDYPFAELVEMLVVGMVEAPGPAGCLFTEMRLGRATLGDTTTERVHSMEQRRRQVFEDWYRRGLANGEVDPSISPVLAARYIDTQFTVALAQLGVNVPPELVAEQARLAFRAILVPRV